MRKKSLWGTWGKATGKQRSARLDEITRSRARLLGNGNMSLGLRIACQASLTIQGCPRFERDGELKLVGLSLDHRTVDIAVHLGHGNMSKGLRTACWLIFGQRPGHELA
jgi:hypothetical protein